MSIPISIPMSFQKQFLILVKPNLSLKKFMDHAFDVASKKSVPNLRSL